MARRRRLNREFNTQDVELMCRADELEKSGDADRAKFIRAFVAEHGPCTVLDEIKVRRWLRHVRAADAGDNERLLGVDEWHRRFIWHVTTSGT